MMKKRLLALCMGWMALQAAAITPLWMRDVRISPDGSQIAFCYKGDIYKVATNGGEAQRLTTQESFECNPVWSPDGQQIAFASDLHGNFDLYVMPANGGSAQRLTSHSSNELPWSYSPDGQAIYFSASIQDPASSALFPSGAMTELYKVPANGGRTQQVLATPAEMVCFSADGQTLYYQDRKGGEDEWRKHHTSSITRDVWSVNLATGQHTNLTNRPGEDRNPVLSPDGNTLYILSERHGGSYNIYALDARQPQKAEAVTHFTTHPVRFLSMGSNGALCYTYDGEIYTQRRGQQPQKVAINVTLDEVPQYADLQLSRGATDGLPSPDGKQVAFVVRGEVFVTSVEFKTTKQITHTAAAESNLTWGADSRTLVYTSERDGKVQLFKATIARKEDPNFANATLINEEVLLPSDQVARDYASFSPDGKELAFIEDNFRLMVLNIATGQVRQVTDGSTWYETDGGFNYTWSPDGQWFALEFIGNRHDPYTDIGLISAQGGEITNITQSGYTSSSPRFVMEGNALLFLSERYGMRAHASWGSLDDAFLVFLNQDAYDKYRLSEEDYKLLKEVEKEAEKKEDKKKEGKKKDKKKSAESDESKVKPIKVELEGLTDRIVRLTPNSAHMTDAYVTKEGDQLYYLASFEGGYNLWKMDLRKQETQLLHDLDAGYCSMATDAKEENLFILGSNITKKMSLGGDQLDNINYQANFKIDLAAEREYMFNRVYRKELNCFYETKMHGVDWEALTAAYRKFLPHINNNYDFAEMLSEWLGELNVSHTGGRYYSDRKSDSTANLGLLYDWSYQGNGLKVAEVVTNSPFDRATSRVKAGVIIEKIDGEEIGQDADISPRLLNKVGRKTLVSLYNPQNGERWDEVVLPISNGQMNNLLYTRWVKQRAADVARWSGGRLGYVHIKSMADASFRTVYSDILGKYNHCEGIVIDTRFNGGGRLHEDIEILFSGKKYLTQVIRGREACDMPSRRWNKPSIMVQCEANYSNAHGTPWVYKHRGIGKLVGAPVPGTMTSVSWETLQDRTLIFGTPIIGYQLPDGSYLENSQLEPDIFVLNAPETIVQGDDTQLHRAVDELLKEIDQK